MHIWMGILHVPIMYLFMFAMVDTWSDVRPNHNTLYMAVMMAMPMLILMPGKNKKVMVYAIASLLLVGSFFFIRKQVLIGDEQFIKSMIPHHSGAILMCGKAKLADPELKSLCEKIATGQRQEIEQMERILERLEK